MKKKFTLFLVLIIVLLFNEGLLSEEHFVDKYIKTVVFFGVKSNRGENIFNATGFIYKYKEFSCVITAKHVVEGLKDKKAYLFYNTNNNKIVAFDISKIQEKYNLEWHYHTDADIALTLFPFDFKKNDIKMIPNSLILESSKLHPLDKVFYTSYHPKIKYSKVKPIVRSGRISLINDDKSFYIDGFVFPGNSGSPVFFEPSVIDLTDGKIILGCNSKNGKLIGIVSGYLPYEDIAVSRQTKKPRVSFEENTGLSIVWSVDCIEEITKSEKFLKKISMLKKNINQ